MIIKMGGGYEPLGPIGVYAYVDVVIDVVKSRSHRINRHEVLDWSSRCDFLDNM